VDAVPLADGTACLRQAQSPARSDLSGFSHILDGVIMSRLKTFTTLVSAIVLMAILGCASTRHHEGTGEYVDDSVITTKVKAAIFNEPGLKVSEVKVETFKGNVQLSGFVSSRADIEGAVRVASAVNGVKSVTNDMQLK
jgi:BON domain